MKKITFILGVAGMLFAGYLSIVKFLSDTCAFDKPCPYFLGYPACYYGFAMFTAIVLFIVLDKWMVIEERTAEISILTVSTLGIIFSGYFTMKELPIFLSQGFNAYFLGLPTCAYGFIFYVGIFAITLITFIRNNTKNNF